MSPSNVVDLVALLQDLVQIVLADDIAQAGERQLIHGGRASATAITALAASTMRYHSTALTLMVTLSRVMVSCCSAETVRVRISTADRALDAKRDDPIQTRSAQSPVAPEAEDHAALVLLRDAQAGQCDHDQADDHHIQDGKHAVSLPLKSGRWPRPAPRIISMTIQSDHAVMILRLVIGYQKHTLRIQLGVCQQGLLHGLRSLLAQCVELVLADRHVLVQGF